MTGIKFTVRVCEGIIDDDGHRPCKKAKCKSEHKELATARKKLEAEHKKLVAERKKCEALEAAAAKMTKKSKAGWSARSRSTVSVTINPNIMVVIPSKIVNIQGPKIPRTSKSRVTPPRPSSTPITPASCPKTAKFSHQTPPSTSNHTIYYKVPGKKNPPCTTIASSLLSPPAPKTPDKAAPSIRKAFNYHDPKKGDRFSSSLLSPSTNRSADDAIGLVKTSLNYESPRKPYNKASMISSPVSKAAEKPFLAVQKAASYQPLKKPDFSTSPLISPPVSPPAAKPSENLVLSGNNALNYPNPRKADRDTSSLISPPVSPPALTTIAKPIVSSEKTPNYSNQTPKKSSGVLIPSAIFRQSEAYRISKKPTKSSKYLASSFKSHKNSTMGTRSRGLHSQVSLFGFEGLESEHKSKKDRSRDFSRLDSF